MHRAALDVHWSLPGDCMDSWGAGQKLSTQLISF